MNSIEKLGMFSIVVKEIDKVKEFYTDVLGFDVAVENKYGNMHYIKMNVPGGSAINLIKENKNDKMKPGVMNLYLFTSDIDKSYKEFKTNGGKPNSEIQEQQWDKKIKQFDFNDPDGNQWFFVQFLN